jgi:hypothetical protein
MNTLVGAHLVLFTGSILKLGSEYHYEHFFKKAQAGIMRGSFALTGEPFHHTFHYKSI